MCAACLFAGASADNVSTPDEPSVGTLLAGSTVGPFTIVRLLGKGGMAAVYEAHDPRLDRAIALKILPPEFLHDDSFAARFEREARVVARLDHPAIVPIFASGIADGIPWMSMRLAPGGSLAAVLREGRLPHPAAISLLKQVAAAIDHAHARGVTHRDIKPANILLDGSGNSCVADFGLAHLLERNPALTSTGVLTGTPHYMAPEQALGKTTGPACDIYSLGIVAYEMIVGHLPFDADSPVALLMKQVNEPLPDPDDRTVPAPLVEVVRKATNKDPLRRWSSAGAFVNALEAAFDEPTILRVAGRAAMIRQRRVRRPVVTVMISGALLASLAFIWHRGWQVQPTEKNRTTVSETVGPTASAAMPPADLANVVPPRTAATPSPSRPVRPSRQSAPVDPVSHVLPPPAEIKERPDDTAVDSANAKTASELTSPIPVDASAEINAPENPVAAPQADTFIATGRFTPPVRLKTVPPNYPSVAKAGQIQGDVVLQAAIDRDGHVTDVTIARPVHPLLDAAARQAVLQYEYAPGRRDGVAVSSTVRLVVSFRLR